MPRWPHGRTRWAGPRGSLRLGEVEFGPDDQVVMAIVNRTPDSFFDQGAYLDDDAAMAAVDRAVDEGAAIVDLGGVKAGPGEEVDARPRRSPASAPFVAAVRRRHPRPGHQRRHLAGRGRPRGLRGRRRPAQRRLAGLRPGAGRGGRRVRRGAGVQPRRRAAAADRPAPGGVRRRGGRRGRDGDRAGRAGGRGRRTAPTGSWSTPRTTSARTPTTRSRSPGGWTSWWPPAGRCWSRCRTRSSSARCSTSTRTAGWRRPWRRPRSCAWHGGAGLPGPPGGGDPAGAATPSARIRGTRAPAVSRRALA